MKNESKKIILGLVFVFALFLVSGTVDSSYVSGKFENTEENAILKQYKNEANIQKRVEHLHRFGQKAIDRRLNSLSRARNRVEAALRLSEEDRSELLSDIDETVAGLESLKEQLEAEEDLETLKELVKDIYRDYRVYAVKIPKYRGLGAVGIVNYVIAHGVYEAITRVEEVIEDLKDAGKDTSHLEELLSSCKQDLANAQSEIDEAAENFNLMLPAKDLTPARDYLEAGKQNLKNARGYLAEAKNTLREIKNEVINLAE